MKFAVMRYLGIATGSVALIAAIALALSSTPDADAQTSPAPVLAQAPPQAAYVAFLVRFRGSGPIARAQREAADGRTQRAQAAVEAQLLRQTAFSGLCFDRFTVGGAEIVLRSCEPLAPDARQAFQQRWLRRLDAMRAVEYVDANATASTQRSPG
jgi:hypothetical protein